MLEAKQENRVSYPTMHEITAAADDYWKTWQELLGQAPRLRHTVGQHTANALGWKVDGDIAPLEAAERLFELGDSLFAGPVNAERSILTIHKPKPVALATLQDIKLMQRRPSKPDDRLGADSLDLELTHGLPKLDELNASLEAADDAVAAADHNETHSWISVRYRGYEFKLLDHTIWEKCVRQAESLLA